MAGNQGLASAAFTFAQDTTAPAVPVFSLLADTGTSSTDRLTSNSALSFGNTESGAIVEYEVNGATTWSTTYSPVEGSDSVVVRQRDVAGNQGSASAAFTFTQDTTAPAVPVFSLLTDTGISSTDRLTSNPALSFSDTDPAPCRIPGQWGHDVVNDLLAGRGQRLGRGASARRGRQPRLGLGRLHLHLGHDRPGGPGL